MILKDHIKTVWFEDHHGPIILIMPSGVTTEGSRWDRVPPDSEKIDKNWGN